MAATFAFAQPVTAGRLSVTACAAKEVSVGSASIAGSIHARGTAKLSAKRGSLKVYAANTPTPSPRARAQEVLSGVERTIRDTAKTAFNASPADGRWHEVEGAWVLAPPRSFGKPVAVVHFIGGAFVGASPEITYRFFLESLASSGCMVITTPFAMVLDQMRIADECQFKLDRCMRELGSDVVDLPVYGVGHSLGSLIHVLLCARYNVKRAGNVLLSYNNMPVKDAIPLFAPVVSPMGQAVGPILEGFLNSPLAGPTDFMAGIARDVSPPLVKQMIPLLEQLQPLALDVGTGRQDFSPSPEEARRLVQEYYSVRRNLLIRFTHDRIDDTVGLSQYLQDSAAVEKCLEMTVHTLPGDHTRPLVLQQVLPDVPPAAHRVGAFGGDVLHSMAGVAEEVGLGETAVGPLVRTAKSLGQAVNKEGLSRANPAVTSKHIDDLVADITHWMGISNAAVMLPTSSKE